MNGPASVIFKFLGTAAAEGVPGLFCQCETCRRAAAEGGRNIRRRSGAMIGAHTLIDFPPDMLTYKILYGLDLAEVRHIFFTHSHIDHLAANELTYFHHWYSKRRDPASRLTVYGNEKVRQVIRDALRFDLGEVPDWMVLMPAPPFAPINAEGLTLTPLAADHDRQEECVFYLIEYNGARMLFANDTGDFPGETYGFLRGKMLDTVSLDCTNGAMPCRANHMGLPDNLEVKRKLMAQGSAGEHTVFISHHFSHNGSLNYNDFAAAAEGSGFISSWDGMELPLGRL